MATEQIQAWLDRYGRAWEERDADAAAALFTADAVYREQPYDEPYRGREGVHAYWSRVTATQSDIRFRAGRAVGSGAHAAAEWWVTLRNEGADVTLAGEFFLVSYAETHRNLDHEKGCQGGDENPSENCYRTDDLT